MVISLPAAWFLDVATKRRHWEAAGFGTLFGVGVVGALIAFLFLLRQPEPPKQTGPDEETPGGLKGKLGGSGNTGRLQVATTLKRADFGLGNGSDWSDVGADVPVHGHLALTAK